MHEYAECICAGVTEKKERQTDAEQRTKYRCYADQDDNKHKRRTPFGVPLDLVCDKM